MKKASLILLTGFLLLSLAAEEFALVINTDVIPWNPPFDLGTVVPSIPEGSERAAGTFPEVEELYSAPSDSRGETAERMSSFIYDDPDGELHRLRAQLVYGEEEGHCLIYVQKSGSVFNEDWDSLGRWFDQEVYPGLTESFGTPLDLDGNGRIILLFYKFPDTSLAGYYSDTDLFSREWEPGSNQGEILYMNLSAGTPESRIIRETIPHELAHLIHNSRRIPRQMKSSQLWIDEGLAEMAAYRILGIPSPFHISLWNDRDGGFWDGVSLFDWKGDLEDYALSFLFFLFLDERISADPFYREIIDHPAGNGRGILEILREEGVEYSNFGDLLEDFYLSLLKEPEAFGLQGKSLKLRPRKPSEQYDGLLPPGAAVYLPLETLGYLKDLPAEIRVVDSRDYRNFTAVP